MWVKILNRQSSYAFTAAFCRSNRDTLKKIYGVSVPNAWVNSLTWGVYYVQEDLFRLGGAIAAKIEADLGFALRDIRTCRRVCDELVRASESLPVTGLAGKSDREVHRLVKRFYERYLAVFPFVTSPHGIERYFEQKIRSEVRDKDALKILLSPVSVRDPEREEALRLAAVKNDSREKFNRQLTRHWRNFCWLPLWSTHARPLDRKYFEDEIENILASVDDPKKELDRLRYEENQAGKNLARALKDVKAKPALVQQVRLLQEYISLRIYRKNAICQAQYNHLPLLYECARRLGLSKDGILVLSYEEILAGLAKKLSKREIARLAKSRLGGWGVLMRQGKIRTVTGKSDMQKTADRYGIESDGVLTSTAVRGSVASQGKAVGRVKIVHDLSELGKVEKGDILVTAMTTPDFVVAMLKAGAIVTDEGGITCHAAIVSREFHIPCIVGTGNATRALSDGLLVEVDAVTGTVGPLAPQK